jgi:protein phosphatase 1 regulatory subunit 7
LVNLEELWLGKNKITKLQNLSALSSLRILSIQSNRITAIEGLDELHNLEELYLSHNGVKKIEGLEKNVKLKTLDVARNFVSVLEGVAHLEGLEELWVSIMFVFFASSILLMVYVRCNYDIIRHLQHRLQYNSDLPPPPA